MKKTTLLRLNLGVYLAFLLCFLSGSLIQAQILHTESFDGANFPPTGWQQAGSNTSYLFTNTGGTNPPQIPNSGTGEVEFNSYSLSSGYTLLVSPPIDWSNLGTDSAAISFWFYRDGTNYDNSGYDGEGVKLLVNTSPTDAGATQLGFIPRRLGGTPVEATTGWYKYTFYVPTSFNTNTNYFILDFISLDGDNCYLDDVSWQSFGTTCTGTPTAGTISSSVNPVCASAPFNLTLQNSTVADGISLQWQSSADSVNWSNMTGDTTTALTDNITADNFYRVVITCYNSGLSDTSVVYHEKLNPANLCYCAEPGIGGGTSCGSGYDINNVNITGTTLFTTLVCNLNNGYAYTQFPDMSSSTASLYAPGTYSITVACTDAGGYMSGWIDFNQDGVFSPSENIFLDASTTGANESFTFQIPSNATIGATGLRIRASSGTLTAADACSVMDDGETEDYIVHIVEAPACSGTPSAGTISSDINPACPSATYTLSAANSTIAGSLKYQWQSSADSVNWSDLAGDTANTLTATNLSASTYYRLIVTCTVSSLADTSAGYQEILNPYINCYCTPMGNCDASDVITNVTFAGINNNSDCSANGYIMYDSTATVQKTITYPISVSVDNGGTENTYVWIDYNHDGAFEASEFTPIGSGTGGVTFTNNIYIPGTALTGVTRMRVRDKYGDPLTATDACTDVSYGETEDYLVNIQDAPICSNPPVPGNITGPNSVCAGNTVTLNLVNQTLGTAIQWQVSTDSVVFADINGANGITYTTDALTDSMYYRVKVTCADSSFTEVLKVSINPAYLCSYCDASGSVCDYGDIITNVTFAGINNNTSCSNNGYSFYTSPVGQVQQLTTYPISVTIGNDYIEGVAAWIDYDHSGTFDPSEYTVIGSGNNQTLNATISIPANALLGPTAMRIRLAYNETPTETDACTFYYDGETEDYMINIGAAPPCNATPVAGTVSGPDTVTANVSENYTTTGSTGTISWIYSTTSATGPFTIIGGSTGSTLNYTFTSGGTYWLEAIASGAGCYSDTSAPFEVLSILHGDNVCDALPLQIGANGPYSTTSATIETGEPTPPGGQCQVQGYWCNTDAQNSLWFTFVAPASGRISINTISFDTKMAVWDAATCDTILHGGAVLVGASDDDPDYGTHGTAEFSSYIDSIVCLTPGKVYYVQVMPYSSPGDTTSIELRDLGPGPNPSFTVASRFCLPATPITLADADGGGIFSGPGVSNNIFYPDSAGVGGPYIITDSLYACYVAYDTVVVAPGPQITLNTLVNVNCHGDTTGAIKVSASNGTAAYTFNWSNSATGDSLFHLRAGSYILTVTDGAGCVSSPDTIVIHEPTRLTATLGSLTNVVCSGGTSGSASVVVAGGTTPYAYGWSNGATTLAISGVAAGTYSFSVTDSFSCAATPVVVQLTEPDTFVISVDTLINVSTCYGDANGSLHVTATGGNTGYSFAWSTGETTAGISGLAAGQYVVTATDTLGCMAVPDTITVGQPDSISIALDSLVSSGCQGNSTGAVYIHATGGTSPYTYLWSNGATTQNIGSLAAQSYSITITDSKNCLYTAGFTVTPTQDAFTVTTAITDQQQGGALGSITQTPNGNHAPYTYAWSNGATTQNLSSLQAGVYVSTVTDVLGCSVITSDTVKLITGIEEINGSLIINIFPNPTQKEVNIDIDLAKADDVTLQIYDMSGRLVKYDEQKATLKARFNVNLEAEAAGVYLAKIKAGENLITRRIVVTR